MLKVQRNFVIFGHARSGTSCLKEILASQGVAIAGEPFNKDVTERYLELLKKQPLEHVLSTLNGDSQGFKHLFHQLNREQNLQILNRYKVILVYRKNLLDAAVSSELAQITNVWAADDVGFRANYHNVNQLDVEKVRRTLREFKEDLSFYREKAKDKFELCYEDFYGIEDALRQKEVVESIFEFLQLKIRDYEAIERLLSKSMKLNKRSWAETLINWSEIKSLN